MQIDWFTFFAQVINFLILLWLLRKFLYSPLLTVMQNREEKITSRLEEARIKLQEAEDRAREYQAEKSELEKKRSALIEEAKEDAESLKLELMQEARDEVDRIQRKWMEEVEREKKMFLDELEQKLFQKIIDLVENIIRELADLSLEKQAIDQFDARIQQLTDDDRERMVRALDGNRLEIATAFPVKEEDRKKIDKIIQPLLGDKGGYVYKHDLELGFGIEVRSNGWKIGWNMKVYLEELRSQIDTVFNQLDKNRIAPEL